MKFSEYSINDLARALGYETTDVDSDLTKDLQIALDGAKAYLRKHTGLIDYDIDNDSECDLYVSMLQRQACSDYTNRFAEVDNTVKINPSFSRVLDMTERFNVY